MNLLFILPEFHPTTSGGICTYYKELFRENQSNGKWDITVVQGSAVETRGGESTWEGINIHYLDLKLFNKYKHEFNNFNIVPELQSHMASAWAIFELVQKLNKSFDAIVTTDWGFGFVPWIIKSQKPVIVHLHGSVGQIDYHEPRMGWKLWSDLYLNIECSLLPYANALITHSNQNITFWSQRFLLEKQFSMIPPAISKTEHSMLSPGKVRQSKSIGLVVGRIQYWKGVIQLCEAIRLLDESKRNKLKVYWIGRDTIYAVENCSMNEFLYKRFPDIWGRVVEPVGEKTHEEIEGYYNLADWSLVPSTWDMFNLSAVEHLMHRKPLICSSGAGVSDFLRSSPEVFLYNNTSEGLANSISNILDKDYYLPERIGEIPSHFTTNMFDPHSVLTQHDVVIESVVNTFNDKTDLNKKFEWLLPGSTGRNSIRSKEALLTTWPLKEVTKLFIKRISEKIKI